MVESVVEKFRGWLMDSGFKKHTVLSYFRDATYFNSFLKRRGRNLLQARAKDVTDYLNNPEFSQRTVERRFYGLTKLYYFLRENDPNLPLDLSKLSIPSEQERPLSTKVSFREKEYGVLVNHLRSGIDVSNYAGIRILTALHMLYFGGLRISELHFLDKEDVSYDSTGKVKINIAGKNTIFRKREVVIPIFDANVELTSYEKAREDFLTKIERINSAFFLNRKGDRISEKGLRRGVSNHFEAAGFSGLSFTEIKRAGLERITSRVVDPVEIGRIFGVRHYGSLLRRVNV